MGTFISALILYGFAAGVLGLVGKLIYDIQQSKKEEKQLESVFESKENFQKLAGITPVDKNDEVRNILVKNNVISPEKLVEELKKEFENSEFPKPDESINVRTERITTIDLNSYEDKDPLASVPMSRVSKEAKQKMAEIAKQDISNQLEQNADKFAALFPNEVSENDQRAGIELVDALLKATKKPTTKKKATKKSKTNE